ncbi:MAG: ABC transporter ATP-binding protein [Lachnospiraceae bacterium]|nr:ABC transporter ATP-binding protein [Lachnospiraceae bacterium]
MIKIKNISKFYKDSENNITTGIKKVSMEFEKGEFVVISGESGSGKSTLLNIISGMLPYEEGELYFCGKETSYYGKEEWEAYRRNYISVVYQDYNLIDSYTVLQNVETALLIAGVSKEEAYEKAVKYIDKVGLTEQINNRATNLSSGQKQRLSIARALAKETDVIVADEPTGNLDEENGRAISALFKELAEDHLVIMVTHNYDQVKDLATRKIRLYNNELAEDEVLKPKNDIENVVTKVDPDEGLDKKAREKKKRKTVNRFVMINKKAQPKRNLLMFSVYLAMMFAIYVFIGTVIANSDDATSRIYSSATMSNDDKTRVLVMRTDGGAFTEEDIETIKNVAHIKYMDRYDYVGDINYYYNLNEDYRIEFNKQTSETDSPDKENIILLEQDKFMKSVTCLTNKDIIEGRNATSRYEVVVSEKDKDLLGKTLPFYFECSERWKGKDVTAYMELTVVGVTDIEENQCFFSEDICRDFSVNFLEVNSRVDTLNNELGAGVYPLEKYESMSSVKREQYDNLIYELAMGNELEGVKSWHHYQGTFIVNEELSGCEIKMSSQFYSRTFEQDNRGFIHQYYCYNLASFSYVFVNDEGLEERKAIIATLNPEAGKSSDQVIEVSEELFNQMFPERNTNQLVVYLEDYAYADDVLSELTSKGYENFNVFRVGAKEYDEETVYEKLQLIVISLAATIALFFVGILIINMMMKLKKKDFVVYDCLGMDNGVRYNIIKKDLLINAVVSVIVVIIAAAILYANKVEIIVNIYKYYRWYYYLLLFVIAISMANLTSRLFNKYLRKIIK